MQFYQLFNDCTFRDALLHFGEGRSPAEIVEARKEAENKMHTPTGPTPEHIAHVVNELGEQLRAIKRNMETATVAYKGRAQVRNNAEMKPLERDAASSLPKVEMLLSEFDALMSEGKQKVIFSRRGDFEVFIELFRLWLSYVPGMESMSL